jgi:hypothetical protein
MPQWEYYTTFLNAEVNTQKRELINMFPDIYTAPKYDPRAMIPELDSLGQDGWELVHMEPVIVGNNADVCVGTTESTTARPWTNTYFCVFKRPHSRE